MKSVKGLKQKGLFESGAGLTCMPLKAFRKIGKSYRTSKLNVIGA
jgi:hypothetical protein